MTTGITNRQMFFILVLTLTTYTTIDLPKVVAEAAGRSGWIAVLALALVFSGIAVLITKLNKLFPGKALFDYSKKITGVFFSRVLVVYYILYFAFIGVSLELKLANFLKSNFLLNTPPCIVLAFSVALFYFVAYRGVTNVGRLFEICGFLFLITTVTICTVMIPQGMTYNILPLYNPSETAALLRAAPRLIFSFGGIETLLVVPFTKANRRAPLTAWLTLLFIGLFFVLIVESTIAILGINNAILYRDPFMEAIRIVKIPVIERTDIFYLTVGLTSLFAGTTMANLALLEYACSLFPKASRLTIATICGAALCAVCLAALGISGIDRTLDKLAPYPVLVSCLVIPAALFILAKIKRKAG